MAERGFREKPDASDGQSIDSGAWCAGVRFEAWRPPNLEMVLWVDMLANWTADVNRGRHRRTSLDWTDTDTSQKVTKASIFAMYLCKSSKLAIALTTFQRETARACFAHMYVWKDNGLHA